MTGVPFHDGPTRVSRLGPALLTSVVVGLSGCAGSEQTGAGRASTPATRAAAIAPTDEWGGIDAGTASPPGATPDSEPIARAAAALQERLGGFVPPKQGLIRDSAPPSGESPAALHAAGELAAAPSPAPSNTNSPGGFDPPVPPPLTLDEHVRETARLASAEAAVDPLRAAVLLSVLHAARPDLFPRGTNLPPLTPEQADAASGVRILAERLLAGGADPAAVVDALAVELAEARGLRITDAALCVRVDGFGAYDPVPSTRLLAGQSHRVILYVALGGFAHRQARPGEAADTPGAAWVVELSEEVSVYQDTPAAMLVLHRPEQSVTEVSRAKRRDFYLVQEITFPRTLAAGAYVVKVTVRDRTSGAQDEANIPVQVVAEASMLRRAAKP